MFRLASNPQITELAVGEHDEILSAVRMHDPEAAAYAMRKHIQASAERFRRGYTDDRD